MSLRARLLAGMALVAAVLAIVAVAITLTTRNQLLDQVDQRLATFAPVAPERGREGGGNGNGSNGNNGFPVLPLPEFERFSDAFEGLIAPDGELQTLYSPNSAVNDFGTPAVSGEDVAALFDQELGASLLFTVPSDDGEHSFRVLAQRRPLAVSIVAVPLDAVTDTISRLILVEVGGSLVILAALGLVSWWVVHLGIRPVKEMTETASRIADGDLAVRIPEPKSGITTESGALAVALNRMLGHIGDAMDERVASEDRLRRFVADASHELRTPITTIRGYAELYRHGGLGNSASLDDAMRRTEQEATRMGRLVEDMLSLAKFDEERPLDTAPVDLVVLARDAANDAKAAAPDRPIELVVGHDTVLVLGDDDRLRQVLANVVSNALVHTEPHVPITITVDMTANLPADTTGEAVGQLARISVADAGDGMPADVTRRVTERFFRADPARSRHRGGSGLGLAIVDAAVAAHGGTVTVTSTEGSGTTVTVTLPTP